ncbi:MAG: glycosyl hydrolase, partial [Opitutus sp.]
KVTDLPSDRSGKRDWLCQKTIPPVTARFFRVEFLPATELVSAELSATPRLTNWLARNSIVTTPDNRLRDIPSDRDLRPIPLDQIRVLTAQTDAQGRLTTQLPPGTWHIFRFGYTSTGGRNSPATSSGSGLECDKLSRAAIDQHFAAYVGKLAEEAGPLAGKSFLYSEIDSYEEGGMNWTEGFADAFKSAKGFDLIPFLPAVTGRLVADPGTTDAVLGDYRDFICGLMTENYYARFTELCHNYGLIAYSEPYGFGPINSLQVGGKADIPMGEFWYPPRPGTTYAAAVSAGHIYGKPVISAESFTQIGDINWRTHPYLLKAAGDFAWEQGINEFMFHRYAHQPNTHVVPGMTMGGTGSQLDGTQTWWRNAGKAWMQYIQRGSWLLRQGVPVSDALVFIGEGSPQRVPKRDQHDKEIPAGYNVDFCNADVLLNRVSVRAGHLVLPEGTSYPFLYLQDSKRMSLKLLNRLRDLISAGATIVGPPPVEPIGYFEKQHRAPEFAALVRQIWGHASEGHVIVPTTWPETFRQLGLAPDFAIEDEPAATFIHRRSGDADFYFFHNSEPQSRTMQASFRLSGRVPELWSADSGRTEVQAEYAESPGRIHLPLTLDPHGSVFVVFRRPSGNIDPVAHIHPAGARISASEAGALQFHTRTAGDYTVTFSSGRKASVSVPALPRPLTVDGAWQVTFDGVGLTGPKTVSFETLTDWTELTRDDLRFFSGSATYRRPLTVPVDWLKSGRRVFLDLGRVEIAAEVRLNGQDLGVLWKPPFQVDVTRQLRAGENTLEIRVTNLWSNRLIGDESLPRTDGYAMRADRMPAWYVKNEPMPAGPRSTFTTYNFFETDRTLQPSGLLGPVTLQQELDLTLP